MVAAEVEVKGPRTTEVAVDEVPVAEDVKVKGTADSAVVAVTLIVVAATEAAAIGAVADVMVGGTAVVEQAVDVATML